MLRLIKENNSIRRVREYKSPSLQDERVFVARYEDGYAVYDIQSGLRICTGSNVYSATAMFNDYYKKDYEIYIKTGLYIKQVDSFNTCKQALGY